MKAQPTNIKIGSTFRKIIRLTYQDRSAVDLTGCTVKAELRPIPGGQLTASLTCTVDAASGKITAGLPASLTAEIPVGTYGYDVWIFSEGDKVPIYEQQLTFVKSYTDPEED